MSLDFGINYPVIISALGLPITNFFNGNILRASNFFRQFPHGSKVQETQLLVLQSKRRDKTYRKASAKQGFSNKVSENNIIKILWVSCNKKIDNKLCTGKKCGEIDPLHTADRNIK